MREYKSNIFKTYLLELAGGRNWRLAATKKAFPWLERFAAVLELEEGEREGLPSIIYTRIVSADEKKELELKGWVGQRHNTYGFCFNQVCMGDKNESITIWRHKLIKDVICDISAQSNEENEIFKMWLSVYIFYYDAIKRGGIPLHAGLVIKNEQGIVIAAAGGTGKSTACRRFPLPWKALSDDETLVLPSGQGDFVVHPFPTWSDYLFNRPHKKTYAVNKSVPFSAIFFLKRAEKDKIVPIGSGEALMRAFSSSQQVCFKNWNDLDVNAKSLLRKSMFDNISSIINQTPAYELQLSLSGRFWEQIEETVARTSIFV